MKWILTLIFGAIAGAIAMFAGTYYMAMMAPPAVLAAAPAQVEIVTVAPPAAPVVTPIEAGYVDVQPFEPPVPPPLPTVAIPPLVSDVVVPLEKQLLIPVAGVRAAALKDTFHEARGSERFHEAIDILAPKGTHVFAVADGKIAKLFDSKPGGLTVYQFDVAEKFAYYYAHLDRYAPGLKEGMQVKRGELVGFVGTTGNADPQTPHLHFAIFALGTKKEWWKGSPINPYPLLGAGRTLAVAQ